MENEAVVKGSYFEGLWKFFVSVKLTVVVLLLLASLSIIGTFIPQNESPADYLRAFGPFLYHVMATLDVFDMYRSWWFQGLMVLLVVNIIICSIDRLQVTGKIIFTRNPKFNLASYRRRKSRRKMKLNGDIGHIENHCQAAIAKMFSYCKVVSTDHGVAITAEKGRWTRLGVYIVHLSVVVIDEGDSIDTIQLRFKNETRKLPFTIQCDDFDVQFYDSGAPKEFRSKLTIIENGRVVMQKDIIVNDPLRYKGINIFQSSYGRSANQGAVLDSAKEIELRFQSNASGKTYNVKTQLEKPVEIPEGLGQFVLDAYHPQVQFRGMDVGSAFVGTLTPKGGDPSQVLLPIKFPRFDTMRKGDVVISVAPGVEALFKERFFTGLQITNDPGVTMVYIGFTLIVLGCMVTFFMSHQQVVVEIQPKGKNIAVMVSGKTNKNRVGFDHKLERLVKNLSEADTTEYRKVV
ncbi:MAG: cytochrome c biogenesis protein ResB [Desulfobacteraceae bacterium]